MKKLIWLAVCLLPGYALADDMVIYRCTSSSSDVPTLQRTPCAEGTRQEIQRVRAPAASTPVPVAAPVQDSAPPAPAASAPSRSTSAPPPAPESPRAGQERIISEARMVEREGDNAILDSALLARPSDSAAVDPNATPRPPLPPIYQCMDSQGSQYLHEYEPSPGRCELLNVSGLGGATPVNAASCEVVSDRCSEVAEAQRCGSWQQHFRDARGRERFSSAENRDAARLDRERLQGVLAASNCRVPE